MEIKKSVLEFQEELAATQNGNAEVLKILHEIKSSSLKKKLPEDQLSFLNKLLDVFSKYSVVLLNMVNISHDSWVKNCDSYAEVLVEIKTATDSAQVQLGLLQEELNK